MRNVLQILLIMIPLLSYAQFDFDDKDWEKKTIGFGCGAGGSMTDLTVEFHFLFSTKDFDAIKKKLESKIPGEKFLASFTLEKLKKKKESDLNESELKKINEIKMLTELVPVCSGCTYWKTVPINELWNKKHPIYKSAESWFKFYYKMNYKNK